MLKIVRAQSIVEDEDTAVVGIGEMVFVQPPKKAVTYALGSCLAIVILNEAIRRGVLIHAMLPHPPGNTIDSVSKYVTVAIEYAVRKLRIWRGDLVAALIGGAEILRLPTEHSVGKKNVASARSKLKELGIPIVAEDVGGTWSRNVLFDPVDEVIYISVAHRKLEDLLR